MNDTTTPLFDQIMAEQGVDLMPIPAHQTHEEFLAARGHRQWLDNLGAGEAKAMPQQRNRPVPTKKRTKK